MKLPVLLGAVLIAVGILALLYQLAGFLTHPSHPPAANEKVARVGPFDIIGPQEETLPMTSIVGTFTLTGGIFLVVLGSRKA